MKRILQLASLLIVFTVFSNNIFAQCGVGESQLTVTIKTDNYPDETTWRVVNYADGSVLASGGPYAAANTVYTSNVCAPNTATIQFEIFDAYGDGICCGFGTGYYNIMSGSTTLINGGEFAAEETKLFAVNPQTKDLLIKQISMQDYVLAGNKQIPVVIYNLGTTQVTSFDLNYRVNGGAVQTQTGVTATIAPGAQYNLTHSTPWLADFGGHNLEVWASNIDGVADMNPENDIKTKSIYAAFELGDRTVLIEHFTQASCGPCAAQNPAMQAILNNQVNVGKYAHISYHTSWPGYDPMYNQNTADPDARVDYYNITGVPGVIMEGVKKGAPSMVTTAAITDWKNIPATHVIRVEESFTSATVVSISVTITSLVDMAPGNYKLHLELIENMVSYATAPGSNGEKDFPNVLRKMLPNSGGTTVPALTAGETFSITQSYTIPSYVNASQLRTVVFIQENTTKAVLQTFKAPAATGTNSYEESNTVSLLNSAITPSCGDGNNGSITLSLASGADALVYYLWTSGETESTISNLAPGFYSASVYSLATNDLLKTYVFEVTQTTPFNLAMNSVSSAGSANNGIASVSASSGQAPYTYLWNTGQTSPTVAGLAPGDYTVTVTDASGCSVVGTVHVGDSVGIEDAQAGKINCFPNPAKDAATIVITNGTSASSQLRLLDVTGKVVFEQQIGAGTNTININTAKLSSGTYFYQVIDNGVNLGTQKLVVLH
ncbi:MAG: Omp28-related outer membrane protein [Sphingobacteriales bacterium]|nr:MAG: Omp28-related outer membrane protein [Sphingobacteriales bacterium]